ncbi:hypothetical protein BC332_12637 [Capsicum chinense]|nr:hypothetical protein BC332_12637 [Capsicum chinense]
MTQTCWKTVAISQISRNSLWATRNFTRDAPKPLKTVPNIEKQKWVCLWDFGNRVRVYEFGSIVFIRRGMPQVTFVFIHWGMSRRIMCLEDVCDEGSKQQGRQQLGDNRHSLGSNAMNVLVCLRDWIRAERRNQGMEPEPSDELKLEEIMTSGENSAESSPMHGFAPVDFDYPMQVPVNINMNEHHRKMRLTILGIIMLMVLFMTSGVNSFVGITWGRMQTQQLNPAMVVDLLLQNKIPSLRLMTSGYDIIEVFAATNISISVTMGNSFMYPAKRKDLAYNWVNERIKSPINKGVNIVELTIGSEPFSNTFLKKVSNYEVVNVLKLMRESLDAMDLGYVKTTTAHGMDVLKVSKFPSEADFRDDIKKEMLESLAEFNRTGAPFVLILFPIHFVKEILKYPMEFAFFDNNSGFTIEDGNVTYTNAVELMIDFVAWAIKKAGYPNMKIRIAQIGWPTDGYLHANVQNAERFHWGLLKFIVSQKGTPLKPGPMDIYLHSLCDENNFATMFGHDKYPTQAKGIVKMPNRWCIYNGDKSNLELVHKNYELACQAADCTRLEQGGSCDGLNFDSKMSYAWNAFFQKNKQQVKACDFDGLGRIVATNPSEKNCEFPIEIVSYQDQTVQNVPPHPIPSRSGGAGHRPSNLRVALQGDIATKIAESVKTSRRVLEQDSFLNMVIDML